MIKRKEIEKLKEVFAHKIADSEASAKERISSLPELVCYVPTRVLGSGSSGTAIETREYPSEEVRCIKLMAIDIHDKKAYERAKVEIECLETCESFAILRYYEHIEVVSATEYCLAVVTEFATAGDLRREIKRRAAAKLPFKEHEAGLIFVQLLLALDEIHSKQMIHRDIKTANIFLMRNGLIKLGDFGFSKSYQSDVSLDVGLSLCGTPHMFAPEIWKRQRYSKRVDIWSLGVVLYELLTLSRPYEADTMEGLQVKVLSEGEPILPEDTSEEMTALVRMLLEKNSERRPNTRQLFTLPLIKLLMSAFSEIVSSRLPMSPAFRDNILDEVQAHSSFQQSVSDNNIQLTLPPLSNSDIMILHEDRVFKEGSDGRWKRRHLQLVVQSGQFEVVMSLCPEAVQQSGSTSSSQEVRGNEVSTTSAIRLSDMDDFFIVPAKYAADHKHAFALLSRHGKRVLFACDSKEQLDKWLQYFGAAFDMRLRETNEKATK